MKTPPLFPREGESAGTRGSWTSSSVYAYVCKSLFMLTRSFYDSATPPEHGGPRTQGLGTSELLEQQKWLGDAYVLKDLLGPRTT